MASKGARFVQHFGPILDALRALGGSGTPDEVVERIAVDLGLTDAVQNELLLSGQLRYPKNVHFARFYLVQEGLVASSKRGVWSLTERGRAIQLTSQSAREIFRKWTGIFAQRRKAVSPATDAIPAAAMEAIPEEVAEEAAYFPTTIKLKCSRKCRAYPRVDLSRCARQSCAKPI